MVIQIINPENEMHNRSIGYFHKYFVDRHNYSILEHGLFLEKGHHHFPDVKRK